MKITSIKIFAIAFLFGCSGREQVEEGLKISGTVEEKSQGLITLELITENGAVIVDTFKTDNKQFEMNVVVDEPNFYRINFGGKQYVSLILTGEEKAVEVNAHGNNPQGYSTVSGSQDTNFKTEMEIVMRNFQVARQRIERQLIQARNQKDVNAYNSNISHINTLGMNAEKEIKELIWQATPSLAAYYGLQLIDMESNFTFVDSIYTQLNQSLPEHHMVKGLGNRLVSQRSLAIGADAPDINLPTPDGEVISLYSLKGKYVLVDFWAAWCRPCRAENPNVVKVYKAYRDENFEILGVSLDRTKEAWLRAIEQDQLPWLHVSDLNFWNSKVVKTYQITSIPATYLIDPNGKIIAKNLRGQSLERKLKEIFG